MKKLAFLAFVVISFSAISCKQEPKVGEPTTVIQDSVTAENKEVPAVDSVKGVTIDSSKTTNSAENSKDSVSK